MNTAEFYRAHPVVVIQRQCHGSRAQSGSRMQGFWGRLQMEMQQKMSTLYSGAGAAGAAKGAKDTKPATDKKPKA